MSDVRTLPPLVTSPVDDPAVAARQRQDDYSSHVVPTTARVSRWSLAMSSWSLISAMVWMFYGALVAGLYGTKNAVIAIAAAVVVYSLGTGLMARWAVRTGLNSTLLSRRMFGVAGASVTALLIAANTTYYTVFESSTLAAAFREYLDAGPIRLWYLIVLVAIMPLMFGGVQTWLGRLNAMLLPFFLVGMVALVVTVSVRYHGVHAFWNQPGVVPDPARGAPGWLLGFSLLLGLASLVPNTLDFARLGREEDSRFHSGVTFGWVFHLFLLGVNGVVGAYVVGMVLPGSGPTEAGVVVAVLQAMGWAGLLFIVVTQVRINSLNFYLTSSNWDRLASGFGLRWRRSVWVAVTAVLVFVLMQTDVLSYLQTALNWQSAFLVPWCGIVCTHLLMDLRRHSGSGSGNGGSSNGGRRRLEFRASRLPRVTPGLVVWLVSAGLGIALVEVDGVPATLSGLAALVSLGFSVVAYAAVYLLLPARSVGHATDPRAEVDDPWGTWIACADCGDSYVAEEIDRGPLDGEPRCDECATRRRIAPWASARTPEPAKPEVVRAGA